MRTQPLLLALLLAFPACSGESVTTGLAQPLAVRDAQFKEGALPGSLSSADATDGLVSPLVTSLTYKGRILKAGDAEIPITGRTSTDGAALGLKLKSAGSGYWLVPVGAADFTNGGELQWSTSVSVSPLAPLGLNELQLAAIDNTGNGGTQTALPICIVPPIPDNLNACDPRREPPAVVISLSWDARVDLDLQVVTPEGKTVNPKYPTTAVPNDKGTATPAQNDGTLDIDSNAGCIAGPQRENLVWQKQPRPGRYLVYANLFDVCSLKAVRYSVLIRVASPGDAAGTFKTSDTYESVGILGSEQSNGGAQIGTFITEFTVL